MAVRHLYSIACTRYLENHWASAKTYTGMILCAILLLLIPLVRGCNLNPQFGIWMVKDCDTMWRAAIALGINTTDIQNLNPTRTMDWYITSGLEYTVPYKAIATASGTWVTTKSCVPTLLLPSTTCGQHSANSVVPSSSAITSCKAETRTVTSYPVPLTSTITETVVTSANFTFTLPAAVTSSASTSPICYAKPDQIAKNRSEVFVFSRWACKELTEKKSIFQNSNDSVAISFTASTVNHYFSIRWIGNSFGPQQISQNCSGLMFGNWERCK